MKMSKNGSIEKKICRRKSVEKSDRPRVHELPEDDVSLQLEH